MQNDFHHPSLVHVHTADITHTFSVEGPKVFYYKGADQFQPSDAPHEAVAELVRALHKEKEENMNLRRRLAGIVAMAQFESIRVRS